MALSSAAQLRRLGGLAARRSKELLWGREVKLGLYDAEEGAEWKGGSCEGGGLRMKGIYGQGVLEVQWKNATAHTLLQQLHE